MASRCSYCRFGPLAKFLGDRCRMNARFAQEATAALWKDQEPVLRDIYSYAAARYAQACAEIVLNSKETP